MRQITLTVNEEQVGLRLDRYLASRLSGVSRTQIQHAIRSGAASINGKAVARPSYRLQTGEQIVWETCSRQHPSPPLVHIPIIYEDGDIVVVDKPTGLTVHPGAGANDPTLVQALLVNRELPSDGNRDRPGIVHRLDKDTSGTIVIAKTTSALESLQDQFATRKVKKVYLASATGVISEAKGLIDAPIGRNPVHPTRMTVRPQGRAAQTEFHVLKRTEDSTLITILLHTGRTHQIRVHLNYIGHPIIGDVLYGKPAERLLLHAWRLEFTHPATGKRARFESLIPPQFPDYQYSELPWPVSRFADNQGRRDS